MSQSVTSMGLAYYRYGGHKPFGMNDVDRLQHLYVIGQTGTGKSTLLSSMMQSDAQCGRGFCLLDPHGDLAEELHNKIEAEHIYWDVGNPNSSFGYNPLSHVIPRYRNLVCSNLIETLHKQFGDKAWGARVEHLLRMSILALLDRPHSTLQDIIPLFTDKDFQKEVIPYICDEEVKRFWTKEFPKLNYNTAMDGIPVISNKLSGFLSHAAVRKALCNPEQPLKFRKAMDERQIILINLAKGRLGADISNLMGGLLLSAISAAAFTRHTVPKAQRKFWGCYVDEFHSFATSAFGDMLAELRKYGLAMTIAQQGTFQSEKSVLSSILANVGSLWSFRIGPEDEPLIRKHLDLERMQSLTKLPNYRAFVRLLVDGVQTNAFTAQTFPP
ncbi:MAG: DUF87 domain-containing protein [Pseudomonadota bacterium]